MKIEFEITEAEAQLLVSSLKQIMGQTTNNSTLVTLSKIVQEIEADYKMDTLIFNQLQYFLKDYINSTVPFQRESTLLHNLGMSKNFKDGARGLKAVCNAVLSNILKEHKPGKTSSGVPLSHIKQSKTIKDIINVIQSTYEAA